MPTNWERWKQTKREDYHPNFDRRAALCLKRSKGFCKFCNTKSGETRIGENGPYKIMLAAAHLDHDPWNGRARLAALCQTCHLEYDREEHAKKSSKTYHSKKRKEQEQAGQLKLPLKFDEKPAIVPTKIPQEAQDTQHITYQTQYRKCGKPWCRCLAGKEHGPYWYAYWKENGKLRSAYIGKDPNSKENVS